MRSTQEWMDLIQDVKDYLPSQQRSADPFAAGNYSSMRNPMSNSNEVAESDEITRTEGGIASHRRMLRREPGQEEEGQKGRKRFSRRHSKNGLAAVF